MMSQFEDELRKRRLKEEKEREALAEKFRQRTIDIAFGGKPGGPSQFQPEVE